ncbi:MAG: 6,7-dimethyl-8-ribityllumazine synthase [Bacteroidota bacterium]
MSYTKLEGTFTKVEGPIAIVVTRWNSFITEKLLEGALDALQRHGIDQDDITVARCPGAYEIPLTAQKLIQTDKFKGVVCLGSVIRGATPHFDYVCSSVNRGVSELNLKFDVPVGFGVLTTDNIEQAIERAGTKAGNKGAEAALAVLEMISLSKNIDGIG